MYRPSPFAILRGIFIEGEYEDRASVVFRVVSTVLWTIVCLVLTVLIVHPDSTPFQVHWAFGAFISLFGLVCWGGLVFGVWVQVDNAIARLVQRARKTDIPESVRVKYYHGLY